MSIFSTMLSVYIDAVYQWYFKHMNQSKEFMEKRKGIHLSLNLGTFKSTLHVCVEIVNKKRSRKANWLEIKIKNLDLLSSLNTCLIKKTWLNPIKDKR